MRLIVNTPDLRSKPKKARSGKVVSGVESIPGLAEKLRHQQQMLQQSIAAEMRLKSNVDAEAVKENSEARPSTQTETRGPGQGSKAPAIRAPQPIESVILPPLPPPMPEEKWEPPEWL